MTIDFAFSFYKMYTHHCYARIVKKIKSFFALKKRDRIAIVAVLIAGSALTLLASISLYQAQISRMQKNLGLSAQGVVNLFNLEVARMVESVRAASLMIESNPKLTKTKFNNYMKKMVMNQLSINLMEWQPIVPASQLAQFEKMAQKESSHSYRVIQPDASGKGWESVRGRDKYVPVLYAWPESYRTQGYDMSFSPIRMKSKLQSSSSGRPIASGTFPFMKEGKVDSGSTAVAISATVFDADQSPMGYLAAVVDLPTLFQTTTELADSSKMDFMVLPANPPRAEPIFSSVGKDSDLKTGEQTNSSSSNIAD